MKKAAVESVVLIMEDDDPKSLSHAHEKKKRKSASAKKREKKTQKRKEKQEKKRTEHGKSKNCNPQQEAIDSKQLEAKDEQKRHGNSVPIPPITGGQFVSESQVVVSLLSGQQPGQISYSSEGQPFQKQQTPPNIQQPIDQTSPQLVPSGTGLRPAPMGQQPAPQQVQSVSCGSPAQSVPCSVYSSLQQSGGDSIISVSQSQPGFVMSSSTSSTITPPRYVYKTGPLEEPKRRFTKEKQEDKGLLGYEIQPQPTELQQLQQKQLQQQLMQELQQLYYQHYQQQQEQIQINTLMVEGEPKGEDKLLMPPPPPPVMAQAMLTRGERKLWPVNGSECPVPDCMPGKVYARYDRFSEHWARIHLPVVTVFICMACGHLSNRGNEARSHGRRYGPYHISEKKSVVNNQYIGTRGISKPRFPTKEERENKRLEEERKEQDRKKALEDQKDADRRARLRAARSELLDILNFSHNEELDYFDNV